jgi:hypothetical protein
MTRRQYGGYDGYAGSNKAVSIERHSVGKDELLEPLPRLEACTHKSCERQNVLRRQDAFYVEFFEMT